MKRDNYYCCTYCGEPCEKIEDWAEHEMCCEANPHISHNSPSSSDFSRLLWVCWFLLLCGIACTIYACVFGKPLAVLVCLLNNAICGVHCWWLHSITKEY